MNLKLSKLEISVTIWSKGKDYTHEKVLNLISHLEKETTGRRGKECIISK